MVLDKNKPYGTVTGHTQAAFEQNGMLFDCAGFELSKERKSDVAKQEALRDDKLADARLFIQNVLGSGPMSLETVFNESEGCHQDWDLVKQAANELGVKKYPRGKQQMWKLPETN